jgi:hypothetical protein
LLVVGGSFLFAAATILTGREVGMPASVLAGLTVIGYETVEAPIIDRYAVVLATSVPQQILMAALGLACLGLAAFLWRAEYRGHSMPSRLINHA